MNIDYFPNLSVISELLFNPIVWFMFAVMTGTKTFYFLTSKVGHAVMKMLATLLSWEVDPVIFILTFKIGHYIKIIMLATFISLRCRYPATFVLIIIMPIDLNDNFNKSAYELGSSLLAMIEVEVVE